MIRHKPATEELTADQLLAEELSRYYADPLGFVLFAYPWGEPGTILADFDGPDEWQREYLKAIGEAVIERGFDGINAVKPIRETVSSGHGIGKSAVVAWLVDWIRSTRPYSQGTVTANTGRQLETKTWAQVAKWCNISITSHWFTITPGRGSMKMYHKAFPEMWFCTAQTCKEENSEAFAGQHAVNSTSYYIFDEASNVPEKIWEVAEGGLTDGEPMFFAFGNPTKNNGKFHRVTFGAEKNRWRVRVIDSRGCRFTNKDLIAEWEDDHGEDSDFFRVRVRGLPPRASDLQFIDNERVFNAQKREALSNLYDPLIAGVDIARGGSDNNVIRFRRGLDARTVPPIKIPGELTRDTMKFVARVATVIQEGHAGQKPNAVFVDCTGVGGPVADRLRQLGFVVHDVGFGSAAPVPQYANMRAYMWAKMKEWLLLGAIDDDIDLAENLVGPQYTHDRLDRLILESKENMKKRGLLSPDDADALALTFAFPVAPITKGDIESGSGQRGDTVEGEWDPFD